MTEVRFNIHFPSFINFRESENISEIYNSDGGLNHNKRCNQRLPPYTCRKPDYINYALTVCYNLYLNNDSHVKFKLPDICIELNIHFLNFCFSYF